MKLINAILWKFPYAGQAISLAWRLTTFVVAILLVVAFTLFSTVGALVLLIQHGFGWWGLASFPVGIFMTIVVWLLMDGVGRKLFPVSWDNDLF